MIHLAIFNQSSIGDYIANRWVSAVQHQVTDHFEKAYGYGAELEYVAKGREARASDYWSIFVDDKSPTVDDALGYHDQDEKGKPVSYIFVQDTIRDMQEPSVTLSHEVLELLANPFCDQAAMGPSQKRILVAYEACDPVQRQTYTHHGIAVSNFVFPNYFGLDDPPPYDYLGNVTKPFEIHPGG